MALDPDKNFDPVTGEFRYDPQWQGPLPGRSFEKQTEDVINLLQGQIDDITGSATPSETLPKPAGTASAGTSNTYSRGDHVHPAQTTISGNAATATQLRNMRNIVLSGDASGSAPFDGTANANIVVSIPNAASGTNGLMSSADKIKLDSIASGAAPSDALPEAPGTAAAGIETSYSRSDHVHPEQLDIQGNAATASKLEILRRIILSGAVSGSGEFDGSANVQITTTMQQATASLIGGVVVDTTLKNSTNPVQNKVVKAALDGCVKTTADEATEAEIDAIFA